MTYSILQFADRPLPPWMRFGRFGLAGVYALQIDASGLDQRNYVIHKKLPPFAADSGIQMRFFVNSTLVTSNPNFEGFACRVRGYAIEGSPPNQTHQRVWDSTPAARGPQAWFSEQTGGEFETVSFIVNIPDDKRIDYLTLEVVVRAQSGQIVLQSWEAKHHFGKFYQIDQEGTTFTNASGVDELQEEHRIITNGVGDETHFNKVRYVHTEPVVVRRGQTMRFDTDVQLAGRLLKSTQVDYRVGLLAKMRRKRTTTYDYFEIAYREASSTKFQFVNQTFSKAARHNYDQLELLVFIHDPENLPFDASTITTVGYKHLELDFRVSDHIGDGG